MREQEKKEFVESLIDRIKQDILSRIEAMPEIWDGIELRQYIADRFKDCIWDQGLKGSRKRDYKNELLINARL
jgi:hypothetical protein